MRRQPNWACRTRLCENGNGRCSRNPRRRLCPDPGKEGPSWNPRSRPSSRPWLRTRRTRPVRRTRWRRWRGKWRSSRPVWTSWTPMSNGNDGRRGNSTSRSRSGRARWSCRGKEPGADPENPASREKTILVKTAGETLGVTAGSLLPAVGVARGTYHYQPDAMKRPDKDAPLLELVREAFENSERRYGYKRIHLEPESMGVRVSAKRIMRLMTKHGMVPLHKSAKRYGSYKGEPAKAPKNLVNRDFHAERPNMLWVTDLTEFSIPAGKAYLSPVIDCHDGMPVAWTIGTSPNAELANGMLTDACSTLKDGEKPIIHSDRGCHYRWPEWIRICTDNNLTRSTGAKGCSPDNAAAEGFFGRPRQEFFHKRSFAGVSMDGFINMLNDYMVWYRDRRIKTEFGMSIMDRRRELGLVA
ncbi:Putative integrase [Bifidobacterium breve S27]|nr:Putative integrase [Bifidobacterium breve S27]